MQMQWFRGQHLKLSVKLSKVWKSPHVFLVCRYRGFKRATYGKQG